MPRHHLVIEGVEIVLQTIWHCRITQSFFQLLCYLSNLEGPGVAELGRRLVSVYELC
jgi:hypothetical protein